MRDVIRCGKKEDETAGYIFLSILEGSCARWYYCFNLQLTVTRHDKQYNDDTVCGSRTHRHKRWREKRRSYKQVGRPRRNEHTPQYKTTIYHRHYVNVPPPLWYYRPLHESFVKRNIDFVPTFTRSFHQKNHDPTCAGTIRRSCSIRSKLQESV